jgi:uncharacterized membrane protein YphA (DoxX/SURF4 family)
MDPKLKTWFTLLCIFGGAAVYTAGMRASAELTNLWAKNEICLEKTVNKTADANEACGTANAALAAAIVWPIALPLVGGFKYPFISLLVVFSLLIIIGILHYYSDVRDYWRKAKQRAKETAAKAEAKADEILKEEGIEL